MRRDRRMAALWAWWWIAMARCWWPTMSATSSGGSCRRADRFSGGFLSVQPPARGNLVVEGIAAHERAIKTHDDVVKDRAWRLSALEADRAESSGEATRVGIQVVPGDHHGFASFSEPYAHASHIANAVAADTASGVELGQNAGSD